VIPANPDAAEESRRLSFMRGQIGLAGLGAQPYVSAAHRWRYAMVEQAAGRAFLWNESMRIGACGDWCLGPRVEAAFESGEALAGVIRHNVEAHLVV
jgi:predicted NAD/FAD-dependent oxidoreductase